MMNDLKQRATERVAQKDHELTEWSYTPRMYRAECRRCRAWVVVWEVTYGTLPDWMGTALTQTCVAWPLQAG